MRGSILLLILSTCFPVLSGAHPVYSGDWSLDTNEVYGGASSIEDGVMVFWTVEPLATPADDADDQHFYYYAGYVPTQGPYALEAVVALPATHLQPYDPDWDLISLCQLGIVASGLLNTNLSQEDLPSFHAGVVYEPVDVGGTSYQAGDCFIVWEDGTDALPIRLGGPEIRQVMLRAYFDGTNRLYLAYRLHATNAWSTAADFEVQLRGGGSARAEIRGAASNLLLTQADAGALTDFRVRQTYDAWLDECGVTGFDRGVDADPDLDGLQNLVEHALALNPLVPDAAGWLAFDAAPQGPATVIGLTHRHSRTAETSFSYEGSGNLVAWDADPVVGEPELSVLNPGGDGRAYLYRTPAESPASRLALRLRVSLP